MPTHYTFEATFVVAGTQEEVHLHFANLTLKQAKAMHKVFEFNERFDGVSLTRWGWEEQKK
jgi:hypothetical protein